MIVCPLLSGSSGNCTYVESGKTRVLIDAGGTGSSIVENLEKIGVDPHSLTALLATHSHSDHCKGLGIFSRRYKLPIHASIGVWDTLMKYNYIGRVSTCYMKPFNSIETRKILDLGDIKASFFSTPHDSYDSVGYVLDDGKTKFGLATDLGHVTPLVRQKMFGCDVVLLEANYDRQMLIDGPYPYPLKQRILGPEGHLDNCDAGKFAVELAKNGTKHIFLAHLSEHNNTQELAFRTVEKIMLDSGVDPRNDCFVWMTRRYEPSRKLEL